MKAVKKYEDGGDLPLNKIHLAKIKNKSEEAYKRGDKEKGDKLSDRASKKEARQKKWKDRVDGFVAQQQEVEKKHNKAGTDTSSIDQMIRDLDKFVSEKQRQRPVATSPRDKSQPKSKTTVKTQAIR
jgi:hypothetical protein